MIATLILAAAAWTWDGGQDAPTIVKEPIPMIEENPIPPDSGDTKYIQLVPEADPPGQTMAVSVMAGAQVGFATEADNAYEPFVRIGAKVPLAPNPEAPRLHAIIDLTGAQGAAIEVEEPQSWKSIEVSLGVSAYPFSKLNVGLWADGGFSSRLPGDTTPRVKAPRWAYGGVIFDRFKAGSLKVGMGADQRLDGSYQPAITVKGWVALYQAETGPWAGAMITLVGDAILGVNLSEYSTDLTGGLHDVIRAGLCVGWGSKK